jgi:8-oxo-dGTP pyrophosphatase MutT (NUDIX family)
MPTSYVKLRVVRVELLRPEDGNVLLIETNRHSGFQCEFPGGKVDENETIMQAALRELEEETGQVVKLRFVRYGRRAIPHDPNIFVEYFMFRGVYNGGPIVLEEKSCGYRFASTHEALHECPDWWTKHYLRSILP